MQVFTSARVVARPTCSAARNGAGTLRSLKCVASARPILGSRVRSVGGGISRRRVVVTAALDEDDDEGFGDIDRLAAEDTAKGTGSVLATDVSTEERLMNIGVNEVIEFGLSGRPLYVCQSMWWLRLSQLKTYAPDAGEVRDIARRSGLTEKSVNKWFTDALDFYHALPLADKATYDSECEAKLRKLEELTVKLGEDDPIVFRGRDDDPVFMDAPWNEDGLLSTEEQEELTLEDPLYQTMTSLPGVMAAEAAAAKVEQEVEEGLDDEAIARIPQDGSTDKPFLVNPYTGSKAGAWFVEKPVGPANELEEKTEWIEGGGWDALPNHEIVSAVDGRSLNYVGVNNDQHVPRDLWKLDRPATRDTLEVAEEISTDEIPRGALRHIGDLSRMQLQHLKVGDLLEGEVVATELYHGALVDVGCETDGLIAICESEWGGVRDSLPLGTKVNVKVKAIHPKWWRFRFPIELEVLTPQIGHLLTKHPHEDGPPINIYSGESVPYAHWDADRPLDRFVEMANVNDEEALVRRRAEISDWVDEKLAEDDDRMKKSTRTRMQKVLVQTQAAVDEAKAKEGSLVAPAEEYDDDAPIDGGAADALTAPDSSLRTMASQREEMIAAEEEEEEALFGEEKPESAMGDMARSREDPDAVEEGDEEEASVDSAANDGFATNMNPEAEDTRGGLVKGVDDFQAKPEDFDDDDEGDDDEDDEMGVSGAR